MNVLERFFRRPQQVAVRRLNFQIHLWAGIVLTLYLIFIGVTGSILVFRTELERLDGLNPYSSVRADGPIASLAAVADHVRTAYPDGHIVSILTPTDSDPTFVAVLYTRHGRVRVASGPSSGQVLGEFHSQPNWLDVLSGLHESFLLGHTGRVLNGVGAVILLLLNATGLVVWWPGIRNWRRALKVDWRRNWRRINFDLHSAVGFWTLSIVTIWAVSGIYFGWPRQTFQFVNSLSRVISARPPSVTVPLESKASDVSLDDLVARARQIDPGTTLGGVEFPYGSRAPLAVLMHRRNAPGREYDDTVYFNPYTGEYISTWRYGVNQTLGDWIIWLQVPLHFGTYWGLGVKVIWAAAGLAIPLLTVSGLLMYWNRALRRKWKHLRRPATAAPSAEVPAA
ncbi:MAG TPA: PepSY-associated TM helix domain-containing protein [Bryobacteraceae bacterium]|nr:PepSY-associated TM helix domain-containing protein [Bryobacteraceae bacterium]